MDSNGYIPDDTVIDGIEGLDNEIDDSASGHYRAEKTISVNDVRTGKSIADFAREAENAGKPAVQEPENSASYIDTSYDDIDLFSDFETHESFENRRPRQEQIHTEFDRPAENAPRRRTTVADMYDKYAVNANKTANFKKDEELAREYKDAFVSQESMIRNQNNEVYHALIDEQQSEKSTKGFLLLFACILLGVGVAVITFFKLNWSNSDIFVYLSAGTLFFSVLLFVRVKLFKYLSSAVFAVNAIVLTGPGLVKYLLDPVPKPDDVVTSTRIYYIVAIAISAIVCILLATNMDIDFYYTKQTKKRKRKK